MITDLHSGETMVSRLRIRGAGVEPTIARLRVASLLNGASLQSAQIAPSAIIFIRRLRDPLPGVLRLDQSGGYLPAAWDEAVKQELQRLAHGAARPALGAVPVGAAAVVFLDASELLACLAADWCEGVLSLRWWWRSLLRERTVSQLLKQFWRDKSEYVAAALQQLANMKRLIRFVSALDDAEARDLVQRVARSFALQALVPVLDCSLEVVPSPLLPTANPAAPVRSATGEFAGASLAPRAPWRAWVPESNALQLRPEQERFLGVGLMIQRQPSRVRAPSFAREVERWQCQTMWPSTAMPDLPSEIETDRGPFPIQPTKTRARLDQASRPLPADQFGRDLPAASQSIEQAKNSQPGDVQQDEFRAAPLVDLAEADTAPAPVSPANQLPKALAQADFKDMRTADLLGPPPSGSPPAAGLNDTAPSTLPELESPARFSDATNPATSDDFPGNQEDEEEEASTAARNDRTFLSAIEIETALGGLFYLINLALYLDLYGDFTSPAEPGIQLSIWDFVYLVATELIDERVHDDPIWALLVDLAGREQDEQPGVDFAPQDDWRLPPHWLRPFATEKAGRWTTWGGRLRLAHPDGFLVLDVPLESGDPDGSFEQLQREIKPYQDSLARVSYKSINSLACEEESETQSSKPETSVALRNWLTQLMPYVKARLRRALGLRLPDEVTPILWRGHSRVHVTATHVDVYFALAELPVEIRLAGLDRDPGWVPSAGRFIAFHYD